MNVLTNLAYKSKWFWTIQELSSSMLQSKTKSISGTTELIETNYIN